MINWKNNGTIKDMTTALNEIFFLFGLFVLSHLLIIAFFGLIGGSDGVNNNAFGSVFFDNKNITILDYTGDVAIIQFPNGTIYNLNVPEYSDCVAYLVMTEGIPRYLVQGPDVDELLSDNELGIAEAMNECIDVGIGVSSMQGPR